MNRRHFVGALGAVTAAFNVVRPARAATSSAEARLRELGIVLPEAPGPAAVYVPFRKTGNMVFIAGQIPAAVTWEPHLSLVRSKKQGKVLIDSSQTPGLIVDVVALTCDYIQKNPKDVEAFVKGVYKAVEFIKTNPDEAHAIMAKGVGGYLEKPADFAEAAKGVRFYDKPRNIEFFGTPDKGEAKDLMDLGNKIWGGFQKMKMTIGYGDLVDTSFIDK